MSLDFNKDNLKQAFCRVISSTGIGAVDSNCDDVLEKKVLVVVPLSMHDDYPERLLQAAERICCYEPYSWALQEKLPQINDNTTFNTLLKDWFLEICDVK